MNKSLLKVGWNNIGAFIVTEFSSVYFALIKRDHTGTFLGTMGYSAGARDIKQVENLVFLKALQWIQELRFSKVVIESDNQDVAKGCNRKIENF